MQLSVYNTNLPRDNDAHNNFGMKTKHKGMYFPICIINTCAHAHTQPNFAMRYFRPILKKVWPLKEPIQTFFLGINFVIFYVFFKFFHLPVGSCEASPSTCLSLLALSLAAMPSASSAPSAPPSPFTLLALALALALALFATSTPPAATTATAFLFAFSRPFASSALGMSAAATAATEEVVGIARAAAASLAFLDLGVV